VQLKFSALMEASKGLTLPVGGLGGDWIVKMPSLRFDAVPENEYAMMTFAKAVYPENKYTRARFSSISRVLWLEVGEDAIVEYTRRLVFNALIGNADAHLKNWSLIYPDGRSAMLAPAYDLVATVPTFQGDRLALSLGDTKDFAEVDVERFRRFADKAGLPVRLVLQTVRDTAVRVRDLWPKHEAARSLPHSIRKAIDEHMHTAPL
jgi:serine/threonine-protein kinase HipA